MIQNSSEFADKMFEAFALTSKNSYIFLCNMWTDVSRWSKNAVEYFGLPGEYMEGAGAIWEQHIHPEDRQKYRDDIDAVFSGKKDRHEIEYRAKDKDGNYVVCSCSGMVINDADGNPAYFAGTITNHGIIDNIDPTTGLYNLYEFLHALRLLRERKRKYKVLLLGISRFSAINDTYGYNFGNEVIKAFSTCLREQLQRTSQLYRMDGTRFAICSLDMSMEKIKALYSRIQEIAKNGLEVRGNHISLTICGGAVNVEDSSISEHAVYTAARYASDTSKKEKYGELIIVHNDELKDKEANKNFKLLGVLRNCVLNDCNGFYLAYQPVVSSENGKLMGMEALLRWKGAPYGEVPPGVFIPWLEKDTVFFELGNWILKQALTEGKEFLKDNPHLTLNINLSYAQLERSEFRNSFVGILLGTGFPPDHLCVELTERCRFLDINFLRNEIIFLKSYGIKIALDDFGTGFASLDLLRELPVDCIKIDRSFVVEIEKSQVTQSIVRALTNCAQELGIDVCVEGIEDQQSMEYMKQYPSTSYQGFYFSRPIPKDKFKELPVYREMKRKKSK